MRMTSKGQVTVPKHIRDKLGIGPGDDIGFREEGQAVILEREEVSPRPENAGLALAKALRELGQKARANGWDSGLSTDEIMEMTRGPFDDIEPH